MKFKDRNEFEVHVAGLAGVAGVIAATAFTSEGEDGDVYRAATHLQQQLELLATDFELTAIVSNTNRDRPSNDSPSNPSD